MDPYHPYSSMPGMGSYNPEMMADMMGVDMSQYADDMQLDLGDLSAIPYNSIEPMTGGVGEQNMHTQPTDENGSMTGIGAGPLPTGFNVQHSNAGSTLTEFTKRRNWSQRVIEEIKDFLFILTPDARFSYVSPSSKLLLGYEQNELTGQFIHDFIHPDDSSLFQREFHESIATGHVLRMYFRLKTRAPDLSNPSLHQQQDRDSTALRNTVGNKYIVLEAHGHPHLNNDVSHLELSGGPRNPTGFCAGFFVMARPYPTKNAILLDSFLEHKLENERLQARITSLKREEAEEAEVHARHFHKRASGAGSQTASQVDGGPVNFPRTETGGSAESSVDQFSSNAGSMPPPAKPTVSNLPLTREALDEANTFTRPDSITDKMARYNEGGSHVDSIEMITGLNYRAGERALGLSTGGMSPALIRGDAGIDIPADKSGNPYGPWPGYADKKTKKVKSADEFVCTDCGTLDSPEWRKGPMGPKTLCNACGLRWAKKEKKRTGSFGAGNNSGNLSVSNMTPTTVGPVAGSAGVGGSTGTSAVPAMLHVESSGGTDGSGMNG